MEVVIYPGPALRRGGKKVETFDAELARIAGEMLEVMYRSHGVGLAAPQVGLDLALFVLNPTGERDDRSQEMVLVNPEIVGRKGQEFGEEGCLSFPRLYAEVERNKRITVTYQDLQGQPQELRCEGFLARIVQHELDHLRGVLFVDRLSSVEKLRVRSRLQEMERASEGAKA
ncbi:MAG: peptide deformylase [Planctomycetes bacterium]|nr:peptide deformylase [Planctomycetota bacterium]